ncbi:uncharacterized protein MCYG_08709 [Microsporum canis CBS 113480]|uniref:Uncharacterized protein n=1 Tax=Arthroderma otae (strain ATCC MYA-4605 / CBS 113480) TaxID=554155 RepID=C5G187_ARTOC|nr:uncharacterized protein MCYG_08709 [Microsporum canis CBS 113480]EEQ28550.1 predicted protein [Microsporum canis CBS 113480]
MEMKTHSPDTARYRYPRLEAQNNKPKIRSFFYMKAKVHIFIHTLRSEVDKIDSRCFRGLDYHYRLEGIKHGSLASYILNNVGDHPADLWNGQRLHSRQHPGLKPRVVGEVRIYRDKAGKLDKVEGTDLTIPFRDMLFRRPGPSQGEGDFVFAEELLELVKDVKDNMG